MKGILLSGGTGSRLLPLTNFINKQLIPINRKPIIDYSINTLIELGCDDITVILGGTNFQQIVSYLRNGSHRGTHFNFIFQEKSDGIAAAINLCEPYFRAEKDFYVCLGDNVYEKTFKWKENDKAQIALISTPEILRFGVASIKNGSIIKIEEKPNYLEDNYENYAVTGCYKLTRKFFEYFKELKPSSRGEYEISEILAKYLKNGELDYQFVEGEWIDCGTFDSIEKARILNKKINLEDSFK